MVQDGGKRSSRCGAKPAEGSRLSARSALLSLRLRGLHRRPAPPHPTFFWKHIYCQYFIELPKRTWDRQLAGVLCAVFASKSVTRRAGGQNTPIWWYSKNTTFDRNALFILLSAFFLFDFHRFRLIVLLLFSNTADDSTASSSYPTPLLSSISLSIAMIFSIL